MDSQIGRILDRLEALGLAEDTLLVFTSDHGHLFGQHGLTAKGPFHYEDLVRVPLIVGQPGRVPAGRRSPALQSLVDFAPSFLAAAGIPIRASMTGLDQTSSGMDGGTGCATTSWSRIATSPPPFISAPSSTSATS